MAAQSPIPQHLALAQSHVSAGRYPEAAEEFQKAEAAGEIDAQDAFAWNNWGVALHKTGDYPQALEKYGKALEIDSENAGAYINRGQAFAALKQFDQAIECFAAAVKITPSGSAYFNWGSSLHNKGQLEPAIEKYRAAVNIETKLRGAWLWQIKALRSLGRVNEAEKAAREALLHLPDDVAILQELAGVYFAAWNQRRAIETIDRAIALDPHNAELWKVKLAGLKQSADPALVEKAALEALAAFPNEARMPIAVGQLYKDRADYRKAEKLFRQARQANEAMPDSETKAKESLDILIETGSLYFDWHKVDEAMKHFDLALQRDAGSVTALDWKAFLLAQGRRLDDAGALLDRELADGSPHAKEIQFLIERGRLYMVRTQYDEAIQTFREALRVQPGNESALALLLTAHRLRRDFDAATHVWQDEVLMRAVPLSAALFLERCNFYSDQFKYSDGIGFCRERPDTDLDAIRMKIFFLRSQRRFSEAEADALAALARFAGDTGILNELGVTYFASRQYRRAVSCFQQVLDSRPMDEVALEWKVNSLRAQGPEGYAAAEEVLCAALELIPESPNFHFAMAQLDYERDQIGRAEKYLSRAIDLAPPDYREADFLRMTVLEKLGRGDDARQLADALEKARPNDPEARNRIGWFQLGRNDTYSAQKHFEAILAMDPNHVSGINGLGGVYFTRGEFEKGIEYFRKARLTLPDDAVLLTNLAWAEVRSGDEAKSQSRKKTGANRRAAGSEENDGYSEAEGLCRQALGIDPNYAPTHTCLGVIAFKRGRMLESEDHLKASIRANSREGGYADLGALYVFMGKYDEAEKNLKEGVNASRSNSRARIELGNLYLLTDREKEGIRLFREAVAIDPFAPDPPRALALALQRQGGFQEAAQVLKKAIQNLDEGQRWQLHLTLAQLLTEQGDKAEDTALYDDALNQIKRAIFLKSGSAEVLFRAGILWYRLENYGKAKKYFQECLDVDPEHIEAGRNLRTVRKLMREEGRRARSVFWLGIVLGTFCLAGTAGMWFLYFRTTGKITSGMIEGLTPTLLAIAAGAFLFPYVVRLKLPGVEAELSQPAEKISRGPTGQIGSK
jgi:tetratricopeptide (TPR) repeat protein